MTMFDTRQVRRSFSRAVDSYDSEAHIQKIAERRLLESLDYLDDPALERQPPQRILDIGCGTGSASRFMQKRWPKAEVISLDLSLPMLQKARSASRTWNPFAQAPKPMCADVRALPFAEGTVDIVFSNLCLQWVEDLEAVLNGFRRVLKPQGLLLFSTLGPETLWELRNAFAQADDAPHISPFLDIAGVGDALTNTGFFQPVVDRDEEVTYYPGLKGLMQHLRGLGATNALHTRRATLTGRSRFATAEQAYSQYRTEAGLPATWEIVSGMAWAPEHGAPIREGGVDLVSVPLSSIPIRRRK